MIKLRNNVLDDTFLIGFFRSKFSKNFCPAIEGKLLWTSAAYFIWVNSNSQLHISFMIYPKNRKCFNFPESLANKKHFFFKFLKNCFPFPGHPRSLEQCVSHHGFIRTQVNNFTGTNFP